MGAILELAGGRRAKWILAFVWVVLALAAASVSGRFQGAQKNDITSYLPAGAESVRALDAIDSLSGGNIVTPTTIVFYRAGGLASRDLGAIGADEAKLVAGLPPGTPAMARVISRDGTAALLTFGLLLHGSTTVLEHDVKLMRAVVGHGPPGLVADVTGPGGVSYDAAQVFSTINGKLLIVTVALVFVLLILIYRSPIFWAIPLAAVGLAELTAEGLGYVLTQVGVTVDSLSAGILTVLIFGTGTDYALLLVSRYREELRSHGDGHAAMRIALRRAGPVIFASASTVIAALLCLLAANVNSTRGLAPIAAIGVALAMLANLTLLPALLLIVGRRAFWPFVPQTGSVGSDETHGPWRRIAERISRSHRVIAPAVVVVLGVLAIGLTDLRSTLSGNAQFTGVVQSQLGQTLVSEHFSPGASSPIEVVVPSVARVGAVRAAIARAHGVSRGPHALGQTFTGQGGISVFTAALSVNPTTNAAYDLIGGLRTTARAAGGPGTLIGGQSAEQADLNVAAHRDNVVILPLILVAVGVILALLLRSLVAPVLLIGTVVLSYGAALGAGSFFFQHVLGYGGEDPSLLLFSFLFLVALGCDYNIFLMARVREEAVRSGTEQGMVRALAVTGAVITSAGIVLAGTFSALASLPLVEYAEVGLVIAFGVLLDTFLVRTVLVPALVLEVQDRVWWPSALWRGDRTG